MKKASRCLRNASKRTLSIRGVARSLHYKRKSGACMEFQRWRGLTRTPGGAYGVMGFSGVKDARKSVFLADAFSVGRSTTAGLLDGDGRTTRRRHGAYVATTRGKA